jgi:enterochelin esterase family protein
MRKLSIGLLFIPMLFAFQLVLNAQPAPPPKSPEVSADGRVTFRFVDPSAKQVMVLLEGKTAPDAMTRDDHGVWTFTTAALQPDLYGYIFISDGNMRTDPANPLLKPNLLNTQNMVLVAGTKPELWERQDVPHGEVHHHFYRSAIANDDRHYFVYTPPNYDPNAKAKLPVLYLLHGYSDDANGWSDVGRVNFIFDNLIATGKTKPMIVVMPLGYGTMEFITRSWGAWSDQALRNKNIEMFRNELLTEVLPRVEKDYRVSSKSSDRAVAGLSMGGGETLDIGLNNADKFAYVGAFSSAVSDLDYATSFPKADEAINKNLKLLYVACGLDDRLMAPNRKFIEYLKSKNVNVEFVETPGAHTWMVWRRNVAEFSQRLFR